MSQLVKLTQKFDRKVKSLESTCRRMEDQRVVQLLGVADIEHVYESSFLTVCSNWEALLESVLVEAIVGQPHSSTNIRKHVQVNAKSHVERILLHPSKDYLSLPTIKHAEEMAKLFIVNGLPISAIQESSRTYLQQATWIRNAVAHRSTHAVKMFRSKVPGVDQLQPIKRNPGSFLRHKFRVSPDQRRYELYFAAFRQAAKDIENAW